MDTIESPSGSLTRLTGRSARRVRYETFAYPRLELVRLDIHLCSMFNLRLASPDVIATPSEVTRAAFAVFGAANAELKLRGDGFGPRLSRERTDLFKIWSALHQAQRAAASADGSAKPGRAKRLQLDTSGGEPLTVCVGWLLRDGLAHRGDGCGVVFGDSKSLKRPRFARYCPDCRTRKFERELDARRRARQWGRPSAPLPDGSFLFFATCVCGRSFKTLDVRQTRCWKCHAEHRALPTRGRAVT